LHDLHGLIWEWVEDFNALFVSADNREQGDPDLMKFCGAGALSIEDRENYAVMMRLAMLSALKASSTTVNVGFRCATAGEPVASSSVHQLDVPLETQDGRRTSFAATGGRVRIATLFYASCPMACPLIIDTLKGVERQLTPAERAGLDVLMVTIDPENDTPQALRKLATERRLDTTRWTLARSSASDVRKLSAGLDIAYRKLPDGSFNHASVLVLMDAQGREIARSTKVGRPDPELVAAVRGALKAQQAGVSRR
jgi:protein SCO1/2